MNLTNEHVFPAFMGGELEVRDGSCRVCNGEFGTLEAEIKENTRLLLNLLQIENRYGVVPQARVNVEIRGMDKKGLLGFVDGKGALSLSDVVTETQMPDGRKRQEGFFVSKDSADRFVERARARGQKVEELQFPRRIVVEGTYSVMLPFVFSLEVRKVVAKIALAAIAHEYGIAFALSDQFDGLRIARNAETAQDLALRIFANELFMTVHTRTAHQHSVMCYLSAGMQKGWALVTLFGGLSYLVEVTSSYRERDSKQFSIFYDAATKRRINPIVLADEMTLIGHVLSPATTFEKLEAVDAQWFPIIAAYCAEREIEVERIGGAAAGSPQAQQ
jgi:hypothetical protein